MAQRLPPDFFPLPIELWSQMGLKPLAGYLDSCEETEG